MRLLTTVHLGTSYNNILNIEKRIENAIVNKGIPIFFAADNVDFLEDTPYGHGTFHSTIIIMYQEEDMDVS